MENNHAFGGYTDLGDMGLHHDDLLVSARAQRAMGGDFASPSFWEESDDHGPRSTTFRLFLQVLIDRYAAYLAIIHGSRNPLAISSQSRAMSHLIEMTGMLKGAFDLAASLLSPMVAEQILACAIDELQFRERLGPYSEHQITATHKTIK